MEAQINLKRFEMVVNMAIETDSKERIGLTEGW